MKHKWHKEIKAWADGAEIEFKEIENSYYTSNGEWRKDDEPEWNDEAFIFRIKPQPKEPQYLYVYRTNEGDISFEFDENVAVVGYYYIGKIKLESDNGYD